MISKKRIVILLSIVILPLLMGFVVVTGFIGIASAADDITSEVELAEDLKSLPELTSTDLAAVGAAATGTVINVMTTTDEVAVDNGICSLREAVQAANTDTAVGGCPAGNGWDTIMIPAGTYVLTGTANEDSNAGGDLDISQSVKIVGAGKDQTIIDGAAADRLIHVITPTVGTTLDLNDLRLQNGRITGNGAALYQHDGLVILRNVELADNVATADGGAFYVNDGNYYLQSTSVISNSANRGGGVYMLSGNGSIEDSTIISNTVGGDGGGGYFSNGTLTIKNSQVISNLASNGGGLYGGAIVMSTEDSSHFSYNQATRRGGGIYINTDSVIQMQDSFVRYNIANSDGGGVYNTGDVSGHYNNVTISNNNGDGDGGGIYAADGALIESSLLAHNYATSSGGALYFGSGTAILTDTLVYSNTAGTGGGGLYFASGDGGMHLYQSIFRNNLSNSDGGAIYAGNYATILSNNTLFENNTADANGGAIYTNGSDSTGKFTGSSFIGNRATTHGGAIFNSGTFALYLHNGTMSNNHAGGNGGALYADDGAVYIENNTIVSNTATITGGGLSLLNSSSVVFVENTILAGNRVNTDTVGYGANCSIPSGAIYNSAGHNILITGTGCLATNYDQQLTFADFADDLSPLADNGGPTLPNNGYLPTHMPVTGSPAIDGGQNLTCPTVDQLGNNRPQGNGCDVGALESGESGTPFAPTPNSITVNTTTFGIDADPTTCTLSEAIESAQTDSAVSGCAAGNGWDTIILPAGTYAITGTHFNITDPLSIHGVSSATTTIDGQNNSRIFSVSTILTLEGITLQNGRLSNAGGCIDTNPGYLRLNHVILDRCESEGSDGGAIHAKAAVIRLFDTTVRNSRGGNGGAIRIYNGTVTAKSSTFYSNTASSGAGAIFYDSAFLELDNSDVLSNTAGNNGGGINGEESFAYLFNGSRIADNVASRSGGGAYFQYGSMFSEDSSIIHNQAGWHGGGLFIQVGGWLKNTLIEHNRAGINGGGIAVPSSGYQPFVVIDGSTIRNNQANQDGGGIHSDTSIIVRNSLIENNSAEGGGGLNSNALSLINSTVRANQALTLTGGGIRANGAGLISMSTIEGNATISANQGGAGIYANSPLYIHQSAVINNSSANMGGGLFIVNNPVAILNSTLYSNTAAGQGAGIFNSGGSLLLNHATVVSNTAGMTTGGVYNGSSATVMNTILAGNSEGTGTAADCAGTQAINSGGYNLYATGQGCVTTSTVSVGDVMINGADIFASVLAPLANEGGPTSLLPLQAGSPAIDAGGPLDLCPVTDQRGTGFTRPRVVENLCDIGAYEQIQPRLSVQFEHNLAVLTDVAPGTQVAFTMTIANENGADLASGIAVTHIVPAEIVTTSVTITADTGVTATPVAGPNYRWTVDNLNGGQMVNIVVDGTVAPRAFDKSSAISSSVSHVSFSGSETVNFTTEADTIAPTLPPAPGNPDPTTPLIFPINDERVDNQRPTFDWSDAGDSESGVVSYTIVITALSGTASTSQIEAPATTYTFTTTESSFTPGFDLPEGDYIWSVKAHDASGNVSALVPPQSFSVIAPPDTTAPIFPANALLSPINGESTTSLRPVFDWADATDDVPGTITYTVVVTPNGGAPMTFVVTESTFTPASDLAEGDYTWSVKAQDAAGNESAFLADEAFTIALPSDTTAPTFPNNALLYPINGETVATQRPVFDWADATDDVPGTITYTVVVTPNGGTPLTFVVTESTVTPASDLAEGDYTWSVKAQDGAGNESSYLVAESFNIRTTTLIYLPYISR